MSISDVLAGKCLSFIGRFIKKSFSNCKPPSISRVRFGRSLPRRFLLKKSINYDDSLLLTSEKLVCDYLGMNDFEKNWVNSCELNFRVRNNSINPLSIVGIYFDYNRLNVGEVSSYLEIPQGDNVSGEAICFACCLVNDSFTRQRYEIRNNEVVLYGGIDYFETSSIDIPPLQSYNLSLSLISNRYSISIKCISIVYCLEGKEREAPQESIDIPLLNPVVIYALRDIPANHRYRLTWNPDPPVITLESDGSILPVDEVKCRWDDYPDSI